MEWWEASRDGDRPCEAAFLSASNPDLDDAPRVPRVTVLASPSNIAGRRRAYAGLPNVDVRPLYLAESELTAPRMLSLMGWSDDMEKMPLYLHTVMQLVRDIGCEDFSYSYFRQQLKQQKFDLKQQMMLDHRMRLLDAFLSTTAESITSTFVPGNLVIVDLTDPFLDGLTASVLFDIVLGTFMSWTTTVGKIVVLDEAHKYLTNSDSGRLNRSIASIIRQQRHLATRIIIATQEPTVIPATILDLASFIMCHRFTSPSWCAHLSKHVSTGSDSWFVDVMGLATGEALVFSPSALTTRDSVLEPVRLGKDALRIHVRPRLTSDGGASLMAVRTDVTATQSQEDSLPTPRSSRSPAFESPVRPALARLASVQSTPAPAAASPFRASSKLPDRGRSGSLPPIHDTDGWGSPLNTATDDWGTTPESRNDNCGTGVAPPKAAGPAAQSPRQKYSFAQGTQGNVQPSSPIPARFQILVDAVHERGLGAHDQVPWVQVASMRCFDPFRTKQKWFKAYVRDAEAAGVVDIGGPPMAEWLALRA